MLGILLNCYAVCEKLQMSDSIDIWMLRDSYQWIKLQASVYLDKLEQYRLLWNQNISARLCIEMKKKAKSRKTARSVMVNGLICKPILFDDSKKILLAL